PNAPPGVCASARIAAAGSFEVSNRDSRSAPRMPSSAASTRTRCRRAVSTTAPAVALMTAVTPPDWAESRVPAGLAGPGRLAGCGILAEFSAGTLQGDGIIRELRMRLVLLGAPGSGKGTQAARLKAYLQVPHISTGDLLRAEVAAGSKLGLEAKGVMARGELVSDAILLGMLE